MATESRIPPELARAMVEGVIFKSLESARRLLDAADETMAHHELVRLRLDAIDSFIAADRARAAIHLSPELVPRWRFLTCVLRLRLRALSQRIAPAICD